MLFEIIENTSERNYIFNIICSKYWRPQIFLRVKRGHKNQRIYFWDIGGVIIVIMIVTFFRCQCPQIFVVELSTWNLMILSLFPLFIKQLIQVLYLNNDKKNDMYKQLLFLWDWSFYYLDEWEYERDVNCHY